MAPIRTCQTCGKKFEHKKVKKYCSHACTPARQKTCKVCNTSFTDTTPGCNRAYCTEACNPNTRKTRDKDCEYCGSNFQDDSSQNSMRFCGTSCRRKAKVIRKAEKHGHDIPTFLDEQEWVCPICSTQFTPGDITQIYCSVSCREDEAFLSRYEDVPEHLPRVVPCLECGETFRGCIPHGGRSGNHFEEVHKMSVAEYQTRHPEALIYCPASIWKQQQKTWEATPEQRKTYSKARLDYYAENEVWNKGLTAADHPGIAASAEAASKRLSIPENNPFYGRKHTEKMKRNLSKYMKDKLKNDPVFRKNRHEARSRIAHGGRFISGPHQNLMDAMKDRGVYESFGFAHEVFITLLNKTPHPIDIASRRLKIAIEVDGCFYHGCSEHCGFEKLSRDWQKSIRSNQARDRHIDESLKTYGWVVLRFWEHEIKRDIDACVARIQGVLAALN